MPTVKTLAHSVVGNTVRDGRLPKLDGSIKCTDCPKPAVHYDHRDYDKPLAVEPVCRSCNRRRGAGANGIKTGAVIVKVRHEFWRAIKELSIREGRSMGEAIEWLAADGLLYRQKHKNAKQEFLL